MTELLTIAAMTASLAAVVASVCFSPAWVLRHIRLVTIAGLVLLVCLMAGMQFRPNRLIRPAPGNVVYVQRVA